MITSTHRFHGRSSLSFVYKRGRTVRGAALTLRYIRNTRQPSYRAAVVVSRKVSKSAVIRNRVRRRIYEIIRNHAHLISGPYDLVFTVYDEHIATMSHATLKKIIVDQLAKADVLSMAPAEGVGHAIVRSKET